MCDHTGQKNSLGGCEARELTIGKLHFRAVDFGDTARLSGRSGIRLGNIDVQERGRCVFFHTVAGEQWAREGTRNGVPTLARVLGKAEEWRREEYTQEKMRYRL